jgi:mycothiol maleylpyruvate isomerase-like protein/DinB family protein
MDKYVHDVVQDMKHARRELMAELDGVGPEDWVRYVPYGGRTLHDLLAHLAGADRAWAVSAQGLLKREGENRAPLTPEESRAAAHRAIERGRSQSEADLLDEMERRRRLLLGLYEELEPRHLALALPSYGLHNSVRERIWRGYHDRLHAADVRRALRMHWRPPQLDFETAILATVDALATGETLYVAYNVDPVLWERPSTVPGWSDRGLLAHIATGDWVLRLQLRHIMEHGCVAPWPDVDAGNAERLRDRAQSTTAALLEEYLSMRHQTMLLLAELRPEHLRLPITFWWDPAAGERTVLDYVLMFERHERAHREQLRPAMRYLR